MAYIGNIPAEKFTSVDIQNFTVSATANYTLDRPVANENEIELFINNVRQHPGSGKAYTASGTALTLSEATAGTDTMYCVYQGKARQTVTPATSSVTNAMLAGSIDLTSKVTGALPQANIADQAINEAKLQISNAPTNGYMLTAQSGNTGGLTWAEAPSGIYNLITSFSPSSEGSNITVDNCFTSTYDKYFITLEQLRNGNDQARVDMYLRVGGSSGSDAGTNHGGAYLGYRYNNQYMSGSTVNSLQGTIAGNVQNDTFYHGYVWVFYPTTTSVNTTFQGQMTFREGSTSYAGFTNFGYIDLGTQAHTGFAIQSSSGNFNTTATRFNVYGITNGA